MARNRREVGGAGQNGAVLGANPRFKTRWWRTVVSTTFSGQPGGAPPPKFAEFYKTYIVGKVSMSRSQISQYLSLILNIFSGSKEISS